MDIRRLNFVNECVTGWKVIMVVSHRHVMPVTFVTLVLFVLFLFTGCKHSIKICLTHINELSSWNSQTDDKYIFLFYLLHLTFCWEACLKKLFPLSHADSHLPHIVYIVNISRKYVSPVYRIFQLPTYWIYHLIILQEVKTWCFVLF